MSAVHLPVMANSGHPTTAITAPGRVGSGRVGEEIAKGFVDAHQNRHPGTQVPVDATDLACLPARPGALCHVAEPGAGLDVTRGVGCFRAGAVGRFK